MAYARHAWAVVKKHPIRSGLAVVLVLGVLLILAARRATVTPAVPSFQFLAGQSPVLRGRDDRDIWWETVSQDLYSFRGDFTSVYEAARAELSALGYTESRRTPGDEYAYDMRQFSLGMSRPDGHITVRIMTGVKLVVVSTPPNSQYPTPTRYSRRPEVGWVSVEIRQNCPKSTFSQHVAWAVYRLRSKLGL
jgi:hypothetical protein